MGCVASKVDKEERVKICEERRRLMKQLIKCRKEFADSQLAYLRSLINTGLTLRQFTESQSLEVEETASDDRFPPSPPPPLPPSPPPPPPFSPDTRSEAEKPLGTQASTAEIDESDKESDQVPPPGSNSWEYWDLFGSASRENLDQSDDDGEEAGIKEKWADTNVEFAEDDEKTCKELVEVDKEGVFAEDQVDLLRSGRQVNDFDDNSSTSSQMNYNEDASMEVWRGKKSLATIVKNLDDYFLKASATMKDVVVFIDIDMNSTSFSLKKNKDSGKRINSAKVFSALSWNWSSRSFRGSREKGDFSGEIEPCKPGAHNLTLEKLYSEEQKLYKNIKDEEVAKVEYARKSSLLQRQEEAKDQANLEQTRTAVESLESRIVSLRESIEQSCSNILMLINEELQPQLIALASGMMQMWLTMHKCHRIQNNISQQLNHLLYASSFESTSDYLILAGTQLQTEVASWHHNFCSLAKFQRDYVTTLCEWTKLTIGIHDTDAALSKSSVMLHRLMEKWLQKLDTLPTMMVLDAINSLLSAISSILNQLQDEQNLRRRCKKLERRYEHELSALSEAEMKYSESFSNDTNAASNKKHPLVHRRAKVEAQKKLVDDENAAYASCVKATRSMILRNLKINLPKTFEALVAYSSDYAHSFENILSNASE